MTQPVIAVEDLRVSFASGDQTVHAVDGVSFAIAPGEILGLVGESGAGKSMVGFSLLGLIDPPGKIVARSIQLAGRSITDATQDQWRAIRGREIAMVFQDPMLTLNPVLRIDTQMIESIYAHRSCPADIAKQEALEALSRVGIADPVSRLKAYPHELSGGMRQRVAIAIALLNRPKLIIADEPTTALDVTIQGQILYEMRKLCRDSGTALLWITHDLGVVAGLADRVAVMYAGRIVEEGPVDAILDRALHPYTSALLACAPGAAKPGERLSQIPGQAPHPFARPAGCAFRPRCGFATSACQEEPAQIVQETQRAMCFHPLKQAVVSR